MDAHESPAVGDGEDRRPDGAQRPGARILEGLRLLLAEDGRDSQLLVGRVLRRAGAEVAFAGDGEIACELAQSAARAGRAFDLILMDVHMPVLDGPEATRRLRAAGL